MFSKLKSRFDRKGKRVVALLVIVTLLCGFTGCAGNEVSSAVSDSATSVVQSTPAAESESSQGSEADSSNTGSSDVQNEQGSGQSEFDFDKAVKNITLFNSKVSLPCTIKYFGEDFSLDDPSKLLVFEDLGQATSNLYYQGEKVGSVTLSNYKVDGALDDKQVISLSLGFPDDYGYISEKERIRRFKILGQFSNMIPFDFEGVSFKSTQNEISDKFGVPTEKIEEDIDGIKMCRIGYRFPNGSSMYFSFADNKIYWIVITYGQLNN